MKRILNRIMCGVLLLAFSACEKDLELYDTQECRLNFYYDWTADDGSDWKEAWTRSSYSFVYGGSDATEHTEYFTVQTMGFLSDHDRPFELEQVMTGSNDAQAGVHYVSFDDTSLKSLYVIPAGQTK